MTADDLRLGEFRPRSSLRVPAHDVRPAAVPGRSTPTTTSGPPFGGDWATGPPAELVATLDASGVETIVDLDGGQGEALSAEIERWQAPVSGPRGRRSPGLDYDGWATDPAFGETEAARLRDSVGAGRPRAQGLEAARPSGARPGRPARRGRRPAARPALGRPPPSWASRSSSTSPTRSPSSSRSTRRTSAGRSSSSTRTGTSGRPVRTDDPDAPGVPAFDALLAAFGRLVGRAPADDVRRRPRRLRRRGPGPRRPAARRAPEPQRRHRRAARRARPPAVHGAGLLPALRGPDPVRRGHGAGPGDSTRSTTGSSRRFDESFDYGTDPVPDAGPLADPRHRAARRRPAQGLPRQRPPASSRLGPA